MNIELYDINSADDWESKVMNAGFESGIYQSTYWARITQKIENAVPLFWEVKEDSNVILSLLAFQKKPWDKTLLKKKQGLREMLSGSWRGWLEWIDGPVIHTDQGDKIHHSLHLLLNWLDDYVHEHRLLSIYSAGFPHLSRWAHNEDIAKVFTDHGYSKKKWGTYISNLNPDEETIFASISPNARGKIRKALKSRLTIREPENVADYLENWGEVYEKGGVKHIPDERIVKITFEEDRDSIRRHYLLTDEQHRNLAVVAMYVYNKIATRIMSSIAPVCREESIPAQDLLTWHSMLEAKRLGCHFFNFAGVNPNPQNKREQGIKSFKSKWGGFYSEYYTYNKNNYSLMNKGLHHLWNIKNSILQRQLWFSGMCNAAPFL